MKPIISVIAASYNEAQNLTSLIKEITQVMKSIKKSYEVIIIDDGSTDDTLNVLSKLRKKYPHLKLIQLRRNFGQSAALDAGIKHSQGKILVTLDADGQNDPKDIKPMLSVLTKGNYDCVCGWRWQRQDSFSKKFISQGAAILGRFLANPGIHDSGCTLRAYKKDCFDDLHLYGEMHRMIPALLKWRGFAITEIKVNHRPRQHGQTKYPWQRILNGFSDMINIWFWRKYASRPMHIFGSGGLVLITFGSVFLTFLALARYFWAYPLADKIWPLVGFFLLLMGIQFFIFGILASMIIQTRENKHFYLIKKIIE